MLKSNLTLLTFILAGLLSIFTVPALSNEPPTSSLSTPSITDSSSGKLDFSDAERNWLAQNQVLHVRVGTYAPIQLFNEEPTGIAVDYLNAITNKIGLQVEYQKEISWADTLKQVRNRNGVDLLLGAMATKERKEYLTFTDVYLSFPSVIFTSKDSPFVSSLQDLKGKVVSVQDKVVVHALLEKRYPDIKLLPKKNEKEALSALVAGETDAYVGNLTVGSFYIQANDWNNVKVAAPTGFEPQKLSMAVRNDWPELASIINKTLKTFTPAEHAVLRSQWSSAIRYEYGISPLDIVKWVVGIGSILGIIIAIILWWNTILSKEIALRTVVEDKLSQSEEKYRSLYDNAPLSYQSLDNDGCFLDVNPAWLRTLGYDRDEVIGQWYGDFLHPDWRPHFELNFPAFKKRGYVSDVQFKIRHKDGHYIDISFEGCIGYTPEGEFRQTYCVFHDVTEQLEAEKKRAELEVHLRQKHKMEAVGYMAGGMAHNFNNNLSIILGNVELSQMKQAPGSEVIPLLENAKIAIRRSRDLVQNIITYSRQGMQNKAPIQLPPIIDETMALIRSTLPSSVNLSQIVTPESSAVVIDADASQIQEVLVNLCNNAVDAMDEKGNLKILLETVELSKQDIPAQYEQVAGRYVKLSVQDTGHGMPAEILDKIFDPFYTTKEDYEGAGMGLATVQGIVAQHGGVIKVNSVPDQGTIFDLYFPIIDKTVAEPEPEKTETPKGTERILFIDDDKMLASLGDELLTEMGYQVTTMTDSTEALKLFTENADCIDIVITDQTMPDLCGKDLILELKKVRPDIPTILCTGFSSKIDDAKAAELGINAFLMKPLDLPELSQTVRRVLDENKNGKV